MRLLLDTQVFVWITQDSPRLSKAARALILEATEVYVSAASIWEIAIKAGLGKIEADPQRMAQAIEESGFSELPVTAQHAAGVALLPEHHKDPFDRLLIAQALAEPLRLLSSDSQLVPYSDLVIHI
jgi:PIN domain nuclease of toxin-antitoxin system